MNEQLEIARVHYDFTGYCPEKGRSHDSRPCCICGKTRQDDEREEMRHILRNQHARVSGQRTIPE